MAFTLVRLLVLGVIAAAADDVQVTWLTPPRGVVPCVVAEQGRAPRRPPPPLNADVRPRQRQYRRRGDDDIFKRLAAENSAEVVISKNGTKGVHQCAVQHHGEQVLGYPVRWQFASMDKRFTKQPANTTARAGQPFALDCQIGSAPAASITWSRNGQGLPHNDRYINLDTQLLFTEMRKEDAGIYRCTATNPYLNKTRASYGGHLRVLEPVDAEPAVLQLRDRVNITVPKHSRARLLCPVVGWPKPVITWEITPPGGRTAILEVTDEVLELTSLEQDQEGVYKCSIDGYSHLYKVFNVTVSEPVVITLQPVSKEVIRASTVRFNCTAAGRPAPAVTWYKDGRPLQLGGRVNLRSSPSRSFYELVVGGVTSADAGVYQCFADNGVSVASSWAALGVTGASAAAPGAVRCWPLAARTVRLRWARPHADVMAYTVLASIPGFPGPPHTNTEENISLPEPFTAYSFQVRAYIRSAAGKNVASDMSDTVTCQGQGVPVRMLKQSEDTVMVSWKHFAETTSDVVQWMLQYRPENSTDEKNITLPGETLNYTLKVSPNEPLEVRLLGSKEMEWLPQNLTSLVWTSTNNQDEIGEVTVVPEELRVSQVRAREMTVSWRCECPDHYAFLVCAKKRDGTGKCLDSYNSSATVAGLEPGTRYEVAVSARAPGRAAPGPPSPPLLITTLADGPERFKELTYKFINSTTLRVSWNAPPSKYTVSYSNKLDMPMDLWDSLETVGNTALISGVDPNKDTYVMVTGYDPLVYSQIKMIPAQLPEVQWWWTTNGVGVRWRGAGRVLRYSQNLTRSLDDWPALAVRGDRAELTNLDPSLPTFIVVAGPVLSQRNQVFNIPVRPVESSHVYLGLGVGLGVCIVCLLALAALFMWRRRKRAGSPLRARRRNLSSNGEEDEEGSEMKGVGRLANGGGGKEAGEPLLNGHVRITENPQSKTPNGKMRRGLMPFDLSRYEDPDATQETVLDDSAAYELLDSPPGGEVPQNPVPHNPVPQNPATENPVLQHPTIHRQPLSAESFSKLPDDNMNSELTRSDRPGDSKLQPTLQPNG